MGRLEARASASCQISAAEVGTNMYRLVARLLAHYQDSRNVVILNLGVKHMPSWQTGAPGDSEDE